MGAILKGKKKWTDSCPLDCLSPRSPKKRRYSPLVIVCAVGKQHSESLSCVTASLWVLGLLSLTEALRFIRWFCRAACGRQSASLLCVSALGKPQLPWMLLQPLWSPDFQWLQSESTPCSLHLSPAVRASPHTAV